MKKLLLFACVLLPATAGADGPEVFGGYAYSRREGDSYHGVRGRAWTSALTRTLGLELAAFAQRTSSDGSRYTDGGSWRGRASTGPGGTRRSHAVRRFRPHQPAHRRRRLLLRRHLHGAHRGPRRRRRPRRWGRAWRCASRRAWSGHATTDRQVDSFEKEWQAEPSRLGGDRVEACPIDSTFRPVRGPIGAGARPHERFRRAAGAGVAGRGGGRSARRGPPAEPDRLRPPAGRHRAACSARASSGTCYEQIEAPPIPTSTSACAGSRRSATRSRRCWRSTTPTTARSGRSWTSSTWPRLIRGRARRGTSSRKCWSTSGSTTSTSSSATASTATRRPSYERDAIRPHVLGRFRDLLGATAAAPGDALLPRQLPEHGRRARTRGRAGSSRASTRTTAASCWSCTRSASTPATRRSTSSTRRAASPAGRIDQRAGRVRLPRRRTTTRRRRASSACACRPAAAGRTASGCSTTWPRTPRPPASSRASSLQRFVADDPPDAPGRPHRGHVPSRRAATSPRWCARSWQRRVLGGGVRRRAGRGRRSSTSSARCARPAPRSTRAARSTAALAAMGMPLYGCLPPTGYSNRAADWVNPSSHLARMNFALDLAAGAVAGVAVDLRALAGRVGADVGERAGPLRRVVARDLRRRPLAGDARGGRAGGVGRQRQRGGAGGGPAARQPRDAGEVGDGFLGRVASRVPARGRPGRGRHRLPAVVAAGAHRAGRGRRRQGARAGLPARRLRRAQPLRAVRRRRLHGLRGVDRAVPAARSSTSTATSASIRRSRR